MRYVLLLMIVLTLSACYGLPYKEHDDKMLIGTFDGVEFEIEREYRMKNSAYGGTLTTKTNSILYVDGEPNPFTTKQDEPHPEDIYHVVESDGVIDLYFGEGLSSYTVVTVKDKKIENVETKLLSSLGIYPGAQHSLEFFGQDEVNLETVPINDDTVAMVLDNGKEIVYGDLLSDVVIPDGMAIVYIEKVPLHPYDILSLNQTGAFIVTFDKLDKDMESYPLNQHEIEEYYTFTWDDNHVEITKEGEI